MNASKILLALVALTLSACGQDSRSSVYVRGRALSTSDTECTYAPGNEFLLEYGRLDVGPEYSNFLSYRLPLYVQNDMEQPVGAGQSSSGNDFVIENVRVSLNPGNHTSRYHPNPPLLDLSLFPEGVARASIPHNGPPVEAGGGEIATTIEVIPSDLGFLIQQAVVTADNAAGVSRDHLIVLGIALEGRTRDGTEITVPEFFYSIRVCQGCLPRAVCVAPLVETAGSCGFPGQDAPTVCADPAAP